MGDDLEPLNSAQFLAQLVTEHASICDAPKLHVETDDDDEYVTEAYCESCGTVLYPFENEDEDDNDDDDESDEEDEDDSD